MRVSVCSPRLIEANGKPGCPDLSAPHSLFPLPPFKGWSLANEMLIMGRKITAQEALAAGLVSTLIEADTQSAFLQQVNFPILPLCV